ncbi:MAG: ATP-binding protein [Halothece sp.]
MLPSIFKTCVPRTEIQTGELTETIFAAKIRPVVEGKAPAVYQDATLFFANTFPTDGIKSLIRAVFGRLTGNEEGSSVIRLETSFGGGKTHDAIALWQICQQGRNIPELDRFTDINLIPNYATQVAALDGRDLDPINGIYHPDTGITTYTLWGEIAYQIGGIRGYDLLKGSDESGISPGTSVIERLTENHPTVIILDEIARHLRSAKARTVGNSDLAGQVVSFLFSLMDLAAASNKIILVYSLASASDTFSEETSDLNELISASARQERILSPSRDIEIYNIVKQRVFESVSTDAAKEAANAYLNCYRGTRINLPDGCKEASYAEAIENSYPFHPELFRLLTQKIASIPDFQRTRGALRLFALVVQHLWQDTSQWVPLIHPHHLPVGLNPRVTDELTSRLQRPLMRNPVQADIYNSSGRQAYAQSQDEQWRIADKPPFSSWVARTIFLHSLTQGISSGIRRAELNLSLLTPDVEISFVEEALNRLGDVAWYLEIDPVTTIARFKEEPSINKIITEEKEQIGKVEAKEHLRSRRDSIFASKQFKLIAAPDSPSEVDDVGDSIALCLIDFDEETINTSQDAPPSIVENIFNKTGESGSFRTYRNRLLFLVANKQQLEHAINLTREHIAVKNILNSPNRLDDISESQQKQLKQKNGELDLDVRVALTNTYRHLFYPTKDEVKAPQGLMHYTLPANDSSTVKGKSNQQDIILKALRDCGKVRAESEDDAKPFAPAYILQKVWPKGLDHWSTKSLKEQFAKNIALNLPIEAEIPKLRTTIRRGITEGQWDLKVGEKVYIKTSETPVTPPETIEFSERMVLYRRGILEPPKPKEIDFSVQLMPASTPQKPVRARWKAKGALKVSLYQNEKLISSEFRPSDDYQVEVEETTIFRLVADYGEGETIEKTETVTVYGNGNQPSPSAGEGSTKLKLEKPTFLEFQGTPNAVFNKLRDRAEDDKIQLIKRLELSVSQLLDYRKLGTGIGLLNRFNPQINQAVTIQTGGQFLRLEYQGEYKGFQGFVNNINNLLNQQEAKADVHLTVILEFEQGIVPKGNEFNTIEQNLTRNPVERLDLGVNVEY